MATTSTQYRSTNPKVNKINSLYREAVDDILHEFWAEFSPQQTKKDLMAVTQLLQSYIKDDL